MADIEQRINEFVLDNFLFGDETRLPGRGESLVETGIVDSTGILEIIEFLEGEFGILVSDAQAIPENLGTVATIVAFVERKQSGG